MCETFTRGVQHHKPPTRHKHVYTQTRVCMCVCVCAHNRTAGAPRGRLLGPAGRAARGEGARGQKRLEVVGGAAAVCFYVHGERGWACVVCRCGRRSGGEAKHKPFCASRKRVCDTKSLATPFKPNTQGSPLPPSFHPSLRSPAEGVGAGSTHGKEHRVPLVTDPALPAAAPM